MTTSFSFQTTRSVLCEVGATAKIGEIMAGRGCHKVAFVTDAMILKLGLADAALEGLADAGVGVWTFSKVVADPPEAMILAAVAEARAQGVDGVVSIGGGSSLDTAKLIAVLAGSDQTIGDIYGIGLVKGERLPLVLAPTTAGTGSEVTPISIVTTGASEKKGVVAPQLLPDWAILDAELTAGAARRRHRRHRHRRHGARDRGLHLQAQEEPGLRLPGPRGAAAARRQHPQGLRRRRRTAMPAPTCCSARCSPAWPSPTRRWRRCMRSPTRSAAISTCRTVSRTRWCCPTCCSSTCRRPRRSMPSSAPIVFPELAGKAHSARAAGLVDGLMALGPELGMQTRLRQVGISHNTCRCWPRTR